MSWVCLQGAKLPTQRRPGSAAPPVYQEEFASFFDSQGLPRLFGIPGVALLSTTALHYIHLARLAELVLAVCILPYFLISFGHILLPWTVLQSSLDLPCVIAAGRVHWTCLAALLQANFTRLALLHCCRQSSLDLPCIIVAGK